MTTTKKRNLSEISSRLIAGKVRHAKIHLGNLMFTRNTLTAYWHLGDGHLDDRSGGEIGLHISLDGSYSVGVATDARPCQALDEAIADVSSLARRIQAELRASVEPAPPQDDAQECG